MTQFIKTGKTFTALGEWQPKQANVIAAGLREAIKHMETRREANANELIADLNAFVGALEGGHDAMWFNDQD